MSANGRRFDKPVSCRAGPLSDESPSIPRTGPCRASPSRTTSRRFTRSLRTAGAAATGQVAAALGVLPGTVTSMLKTLSESNLATYTPYEGVSLTPAGNALALRVLRRHRLIELFLSRTLDLDLGRGPRRGGAHGACGQRLARGPHRPVLGIRKSTPTATRFHVRMARFAASRITGTWRPARRGRRFRLMRVTDQSPDFLRYLTQSGLPLGTEGRVVSESLGGGRGERGGGRQVTRWVTRRHEKSWSK